MTTNDATDPRVVPEVHEQENPNEEVNENNDEYEETPDKPDDEDHEMEVEILPEPDTVSTSSSSRREKRIENTIERVREKTVDQSADCQLVRSRVSSGLHSCQAEDEDEVVQVLDEYFHLVESFFISIFRNLLFLGILDLVLSDLQLRG